MPKPSLAFFIIVLFVPAIAAEPMASESSGEEVWTDHVQQSVSVLIGIVLVLLLLLVCCIGRRRNEVEEKICFVTESTPQKAPPSKVSKSKAAKDGKPRRRTSDEEPEPPTPHLPAVSSSSDAKEKDGGSGSPKRTRRRKKKRARPKVTDVEKPQELEPRPPAPVELEISDEVRGQEREEEWTAPRRRGARAPAKPSASVEVDFVPTEAAVVLETPPPLPAVPAPAPVHASTPPTVVPVAAPAPAPLPAPLPTTPDVPLTPPMQTWAALPDRSSINIEASLASGAGFRPGGTAASFSSNLTLGHFIAAPGTSPKRRNGRQRPATSRAQTEDSSAARRDDSGFLSVSGDQEGVWGAGLSSWNAAIEVPPTVDECAGSGGGVLTQAVQFYQSRESYQFEMDQARNSGDSAETEVDESILEEKTMVTHAAPVLGRGRGYAPMNAEIESEDRQDIIDNINSLIMTPDMHEDRPTAELYGLMHSKKQARPMVTEHPNDDMGGGWDVADTDLFHADSATMAFALPDEGQIEVCTTNPVLSSLDQRQVLNTPINTDRDVDVGLSLHVKADDKGKESKSGSSSDEDEDMMAGMAPITADVGGETPSLSVSLGGAKDKKDLKEEDKKPESGSSSDEDDEMMAGMAPITADVGGETPSLSVSLGGAKDKKSESGLSSVGVEDMMAGMAPITADLDTVDAVVVVKDGSPDSEQQGSSNSMSSYELVEEEMVADCAFSSETGVDLNTPVVRSSMVVDVTGDFVVASPDQRSRTGLIVSRSERASSVESWSESDLQLHPVSAGSSAVEVEVNTRASTEISTLVGTSEDPSRRRQRFVESAEVKLREDE